MPKKKTPEKPKKKVVAKRAPRTPKDCLRIDNLAEVTKKVKQLMVEKAKFPGTVQDGEAGLVFIKGEPHRVIDDNYVHNNEAEVILQTRKVVREYLKLQELIKKNKEKK